MQFKQWWPYGLLVLLGVLLYGRSVTFGYTYYDDQILLLNNQSFLSDLTHIPTAFTQHVFASEGTAAVFYRPLLVVSFIIDTVIGNGNVWVYHATNILLYLVSVCLMLWVLMGLSYGRPAALMGAMVFATHPILVQAVGWLPGRNDSLLGVFFLGSMGAFLRRKWGWHLALFALALFTKETAVVIPLLCWFHTLWYRPKEMVKVRGMLQGWVLVGFCWYILRHIALTSPGKVGMLERLSAGLSVVPSAILLYLGKLVWPNRLSPLPVLADVQLIPGIVAVTVILLAVISYYYTVRHLRIVWSLLWFLLALLPGLVPVEPAKQAVFLEHRLYVPWMGVVLGILEWGRGMGVSMRRWGYGVVLLGVAVGGILTFRHVGVFADSPTFWDAAVAASPKSAAAHHNRGAMLQMRGDYLGAKQEYMTALTLDSRSDYVRHNLAELFVLEKNWAEAEAWELQQLEMQPFSDAWFYLARIYTAQGREAAAMEALYKAVAMDPNHAGANGVLAQYYYARKDYARAWPYYTIARKHGLQLDFSFVPETEKQ